MNLVHVVVARSINAAVYRNLGDCIFLFSQSYSVEIMAICILVRDFYKSHLIFNLTNSNFAI